jgi:tRNA modification GTPase
MNPTNATDSAISVTRLTPGGRGAVATLCLEGPGCVDLLSGEFHPHRGPAVHALPTGRIILGRFGNPPGEEVVVCRVAPDVIEIHCHGGEAAAGSILARLVDRGACRMAWTDRVARSHVDPIPAAAQQALAEAPTSQTAAILLDQYQGALSGAIADLTRDLGRSATGSDLLPRLERLLQLSNLGLHLSRPWKVVLAGPANVGKSSLINALLGYDRAIVYDQPGTTRDVIKTTTALGGWPVELADTAGFRNSDDPLERRGLKQAHTKGITADLICLVHDATNPTPAEALAAQWADRPVLAVYNKRDLLNETGTLPPEVVATSATHGAGIQTLIDKIVEHLVPVEPEPGEAVPFTQDQVDSLRSIHAALTAQDLDTAGQRLRTWPWLSGSRDL